MENDNRVNMLASTLKSWVPQDKLDELVQILKPEQKHEQSSSENMLKSVNEVISMRNFFIPYYQRGYRWKKTHVCDFLDDIYELIEQKKQKQNKKNLDWICMQTMVVQKQRIENSLDNNFSEIYHVIDGQQRLTTIKLILEVLGKRSEELYKLWYSSYDNQSRASFAFQEKGSCMDEFFKEKAKEAIIKWKEDKNVTNENLIKEICENTRFIWIDLESKENPIDYFTRLNINRIPLQSSDLIKALLLREHVYSDIEDASNIQGEIAIEWNEIEDAISDDRFWLMFNRPTDSHLSRMEQMFMHMYQNTYEGSKSHTADIVFRFFSDFIKNGNSALEQTLKVKSQLFFKGNELKTIRHIWDSFKELYYSIREWYNDFDLYHYIGVLCSISPDTSIDDLLTVWKNGKINSETNEEYKPNKKDFKKYIRDKIKKVKGFTYEKEKYPKETDIKLNELYYREHNDIIRRVLLIHNVSTIMIQNRIPQREEFYKNSPGDLILKNMGNRFPFHMYRKCTWNIEHVFSRAQEKGDLKPNEEMIKCIQQIIFESEELREQCMDIESLIDKYNKDKADETYKNIIEWVKKNTEKFPSLIPEENKDSIANLVLLDSTTNQGYGNAPFCEKKNRILDSWLAKIKMQPFAFIPPCTLAAFTKAYTMDTDDTNTGRTSHIAWWDSKDSEMYLKDICNKIQLFFENEN